VLIARRWACARLLAFLLARFGIFRRLEIHYTAKHGSRRNIAEIELSVLTRQCLDQRIEGIEWLKAECYSWNAERNGLQKGVDWQFTTDDARIKLKRLYPQIQF